MDNWSLELRVVWEDLPDLIEIETRVCAGEWSARARAYVSPASLVADAERLIAWARQPVGNVRLEAGADTGIGWLVLDFFTVDAWGHCRCAVTLATGRVRLDARPTEVWRFAVELQTELGLIERFGRECLSLRRDPSCVAQLSGLPT